MEFKSETHLVLPVLLVLDDVVQLRVNIQQRGVQNLGPLRIQVTWGGRMSLLKNSDENCKTQEANNGFGAGSFRHAEKAARSCKATAFHVFDSFPLSLIQKKQCTNL